MRYNELEFAVKIGTYIEYRKLRNTGKADNYYKDYNEYDNAMAELNYDFDPQTYLRID